MPEPTIGPLFDSDGDVVPLVADPDTHYDDLRESESG